MRRPPGGADATVDRMHHFMHPWSAAFTDLFYRGADGVEAAFEFRTDDGFPLQGDAPVVALHDREGGNGVVMLPGEGQGKCIRLVWDRKCYRMDYVADFRNSFFPEGAQALLCRQNRVFSAAGCRQTGC